MAQPGRKTAAFEYHSPEGGRDELASVVRVLYLNNIGTLAGMQELQQVMRSNADIQRVFFITTQKALVIRAEPPRVAMAEWLVQELDRPAQPGRKTAAFECHSPDGRDALASAVRVLYLNNIGTPPGMQELQVLVRSGAEIPRVFGITAQKALVIRAERVAMAEWFVEQVDRPAEPGRKPASYQYHPPGSGSSGLETAARVYYPAHITAPPAALALEREIRTTAGIPRVFYCSESGTLAFRGTPEAVARAEKLIADEDRPGAQ